MTSAIDRLWAAKDEAAKPVTRTTGEHLAAQYEQGEDGTAYGIRALNDEIAKLAAVDEGSRDNDANTVALKLGRVVAAGQLSEDAVRHALTILVSEDWDYPAGDPFTTRDVERWMRSGFAAGLKDPRDVTPREDDIWGPFSLDLPTAPGDSLDSAIGQHADSGSTSATPLPTSPALSNVGTVDGFTPEQRYERQVERKAHELAVQRDANRLVLQREAVKTFRYPPHTLTLVEELALPEEAVSWAIQDLMPSGANVVLTAQYKTGKTTMINSLTKALADGLPFLGRYDVKALDGRVGIWNYEVGDQQYRRWLRAVNIEHPENVSILNLRGFRVPLGLPFGEDYAVDWLKTHGIKFWVLDPYARAMIGSVTDENSNSEVGVFLDTLDVIKSRAGVGELVVPTHTGRGEGSQDRARGATRLNDWADIQWILSRNTDGGRFLGANGRDVNVVDGGLKYDDDTGSYTWTGEAPAEAAASAAQSTLLSWVARNPGIVTRRLGEGPGVNKNKTSENIKALIDQGLVVVIDGQRRAKHHYIHTYEGEFLARDYMDAE